MTFPLRTALSAIVALIGTAASADAGWANVFQLTCNDCRPRTSFFAPRDCEPQPEARVSYQQRCYYQPVTEMKRESYFVPVKENVRSYYYEPVTSCTYTSYYDPCSGACQEIAVPRTSYRLREKCDTVTRMQERCRMVPVTSYRRVTMYQPVVTYYYPPTPCPPSTSNFRPLPAPRIEPLLPAPSITPQTDSAPGGTETIGPMNLPTTPADGTGIPRQMPPSGKQMRANTAGLIRGEVVGQDKLTPRPGSKLVFVNAADHADRRYATANDFGEFDATLPAGDWYLYVGGANGQAERYKKLTIAPSDRRTFRLVSR